MGIVLEQRYGGDAELGTLAQLVEHLAVNQRVVGSSPTCTVSLPVRTPIPNKHPLIAVGGLKDNEKV